MTVPPSDGPRVATDAGAARPVVAIYRTEVLPLSETFVRDQALALRRWQPILVGERQINALPLSGLAVSTCHSGPATLAQRVASLAWRRLDRPSPSMVALVRRAVPKLIHAHFGFDGVEAWPIAQRLGLPLLVTLHGSDITTTMEWFTSGRAGRRWAAYPSRLAGLAKERRVSFVAISENIRRAALDAGLPSERIFVERIGVNIGGFAPGGLPIAKRQPMILFLGRLVEKKGCSFLIESFKTLRREIPGCQLVVAGDGPLRADLEAQATGLDGVRFAGSVSHDEVRALMQQARVFCLPSITAESGDAEGLPLVILEAQASGVPVVTSARGGAEEGIRDGETGLAFPERDVAAMTQYLSDVLTDDVLATRMSEAAPGFIAAEHDLLKCTARLERVYDLVSGTRS